jgi:hypothetical protein
MTLTASLSSTMHWSYPLSETRNSIVVTSWKQWIHFRRSDLCPTGLFIEEVMFGESVHTSYVDHEHIVTTEFEHSFLNPNRPCSRPYYVLNTK